jgi:CubicO group peptidase (beta-lactamase class C family)
MARAISDALRPATEWLGAADMANTSSAAGANPAELMLIARSSSEILALHNELGTMGASCGNRPKPPALARRFALVGLAALALVVGPGCAAAKPPPYTDPAILLTLTPEQQVSIFGHLDTRFPVARVKRGRRVSPLRQATQQIAPDVTWKRHTYTTGDFMAAARFTGVLAIKDGRVVMERYALGRQAGDRWDSFSVAKSITSTLIGAAIKDGHIKNLDDPVTAYLPEMQGSAYDGVTLRQLLTMTSGVRWNEDYTDPKSDVAVSSNWVGEPGIEPLVSYMRRLPREAPPGTEWRYKTGETDLAGILLGRAVREPLSTYLSEKIWRPVGMERDAVWMLDRGGLERGGCCLGITLRDYGRLALFIDGGAVVHGRSIVPDGWLTAATINEVNPPGPVPYGYFWWPHPDGYEAIGIFGQSIRFIPTEHLIVITNGATPQATGPDIDSAKAALLDAVRTALALRR